MCTQHGKAGRLELRFRLTIALHGLLGRQDERVEAGERLGDLQEGMLEQLGASPSLLYVHFEAAVEEVPEDGRELLWVLKFRGAVGSD